jgi:predicted N-formylglutamate amidohydrolase
MQRHRREMIEPVSTDSYIVVAGAAAAGLLLLCDHADNAFPAGYGTLGLVPLQLARHIAYDIGAAEITRRLAKALGVPAVLTRYSRLLIDPNRGEDDPTLIMRLSDGAIIPGNRRIDAAERQKRIERYYRPYHEAVDRVVDTCLNSGVSPAVLAIHSFTETWRGHPRPWHAGILWDKDERLALPLLKALSAEPDLVVGDNEPYAGQLEGDTLWQHGFKRGLPHAALEVRQDLIGNLAGQLAWAVRLERLIRELSGPFLHFAFSLDAVQAVGNEGATSHLGQLYLTSTRGCPDDEDRR